jgi:hypothetical protein
MVVTAMAMAMGLVAKWAWEVALSSARVEKVVTTAQER